MTRIEVPMCVDGENDCIVTAEVSGHREDLEIIPVAVRLDGKNMPTLTAAEEKDFLAYFDDGRGRAADLEELVREALADRDDGLREDADELREVAQ